MYKYNNNILPQSFDGHFINHQLNHNYNTRNKDDYQFHMFWLNTVLNTGPKIWNNLPKHIKCSKTLRQFKRKIVSCLNSWISQLHFRSGKLVIDFSYGQNKSPNVILVFNDELFHVHACLLDSLFAFVFYLILCLPLFNVCSFVVVFNCKGGATFFRLLLLVASPSSLCVF